MCCTTLRVVMITLDTEFQLDAEQMICCNTLQYNNGIIVHHSFIIAMSL